MELGEKLRQARLESGLSQRQLCGDAITRNMLSQIENGAARPSMSTLRYLAARLGRPVSWFLEEDSLSTPNRQVMEQLRSCWDAGDPAGAMEKLENYHSPDPVYDREKTLLEMLVLLALSRTAIGEGKLPLARELLERAEHLPLSYCAGELERQRLMLLARAEPQRRKEICGRLPALDEELLLRADGAMASGNLERAAQLLEAAEEKTSPEWNLLRGRVYLAEEDFTGAAGCFRLAEDAFPEETAPALERCYRELEDYKKAYFYACKQKDKL